MASLDAIRSSEINLLIDPTFEDPGRHFNFLMDGFCEASTLRGKVTREIFDLNRRQLVSERMSAFDGVINAWPRCINGDSQLLEKIFEISAPHAGARLDALKRALSSWPIASQLDSTSRRSLPRSFASALTPAPAKSPEASSSGSAMD
jgi:hypothetical protein